MEFYHCLEEFVKKHLSIDKHGKMDNKIHPKIPPFQQIKIGSGT